MVADSQGSARVWLEAEDIARRADQPTSSLHLLLAFFTFPNRAQALLIERGLDDEKLLNHVRVLEDEARGVLTELRERAKEFVRNSGDDSVDCLHMLIALTRQRNTFAYRVLERTGVSITALRNLAVSYVTGNMPRRFKAILGSEVSPQVSERTRRRRPVSTQVHGLATAPRVPKREGENGFSKAEEPEEDHDHDGDLDAGDDTDGDDDTAVQRPLTGRSRERPAGASSSQTLADIAPTLAQCGMDLLERARLGELDQVIGREAELDALVDILGKRRSNNPVLVGPPGVGKTAIVEGLAVKVAAGDRDVAHLRDGFIVALDTGSMVAGTSLRGAFSERMSAIKDEVAGAQRRILVFIDELHTLIGAGSSGDGPQDAAHELKAALARGEFPCIGATTIDEFRKYIEKDPALERRFTPITVDEPSVDDAILMLEGAINTYSRHHQVDYSMDAVQSAVRLTHRIVPERKLPDKAFAVVDLAGSRARRRRRSVVERLDIAQVIHEWSGVPLDRLAEVEADRFNHAEQTIAQSLIGHGDVVSAVAAGIRRGMAGFNARRPIASFLFLGPTGVGKTELVKVLADFLFGHRDAIVRLDMSEFVERHSVSRLVGAQPGYVGYDEGGQLTEALRRRPFQIVLFDEVEKAHRDVLNILLQILDEGHLSDSRGRRVSFANTVVVLTSNLGSEHFWPKSKEIGFGGRETMTDIQGRVLETARAEFAPELWGRLDERLVFEPLQREQVRRVAELQLEESSEALFAERTISLEWSDDVLDYLLSEGGYTPRTGARGMRQTIQRLVQGPVAEAILSGQIGSGDVVELTLSGGVIRVSRAHD